MDFIEMIKGLEGKEATAEEIAKIVGDAEKFKSDNHTKFEKERTKLENQLETEKKSTKTLSDTLDELKAKSNENNSTEFTKELELRIKELESELSTKTSSYTELETKFNERENTIKFGEATDKASTLLDGYGIKHKGMIKDAAKGLYKNSEGEWYWKNKEGDKIIPAKERIEYLTSSEDHLKPYVVAKGADKGGTGHQGSGSGIPKEKVDGTISSAMSEIWGN